MNLPYSLILTSSEAILQRISACRLALDKSSLFVQFLAAAIVLFVLAPSSVFAANQTWTNNGSVSGNWSEISNWGGNTAPGATLGNASTDVATFNTTSGNYGTTIAPILIDTYLNIRGLTFNGSSGNYTIGNSTGSNALHMTANGTILIGNGLTTDNTTITINAPLLMYGNLAINNAATNNSNNKFVISGNISSATAGAKTLNINSVTSNSTHINDITGLISNGNGTVSVTQSTSGGNWRLLNDANSFTGNLSVQGGSVTVSSIGNQGVASAAGAGTTINIGSTSSGANLIFSGNGTTTNRTINMAGTTGNATITANNASGLLKFTSNFSATGAGNKTLILRGTGAGGAEISGSIVDSSGNSTSVNKNDTGTWILSGNNTYSGVTTVSAGVLNIQHANALGATSGNTTVLSGAALQLQGGITVGAEALSLTGTGVSATGALRNISGSNTYGGAITLAGATRINSDADLLTLSGGIGGTHNLTIGGAGNTTINSAIATSNGTLTKDGGGTLVLSGANTFTGGVTINDGTLQLGNAGALNSTAGSENAVTFGASSTGALTLNGNSVVIRSLNTNATPGTPVVQNANAAAATLTVGNSANATSTYAGVIQDGSGGGALSLIKAGTGTWTLSGNNTYSGVTTISAGNLSISHANALGTTGASNGTTIAAGAALLISNNINVAETITLNSTGAGGNNGGIRNTGGDNTISGAINLGATSRIAVNSGNLTIAGGVNATTNLNLTVGTSASNTSANFTSAITLGSGTFNAYGGNLTNAKVVLGATGNIFGTVRVDTGGTIRTDVANAWNSSANMVLGTSESTFQSNTFDLNGNSQTVASLTSSNDRSIGGNGGSGNATNTITSANDATLTVNGSSSTIYRGTITGAISLAKAGAGNLTLTGNNTYTGATSVNAGTLLINGSTHSSSAVTVANGATLGGSGTINGATTINGNLVVGNGGVGVLTFGSSLVLNSQANVSFTLNGTTRGTNYTGITLQSSDLTYGGNLTINVTSAFLNSSPPFSLFSGFVNQTGNFASVSLSGLYGSGSFAETTSGSGVWNLWDSSGNQWSFDKSTGNLAFTAIPEPSVYALLLTGLAAMAILNQRRRKARADVVSK